MRIAYEKIATFYTPKRVKRKRQRNTHNTSVASEREIVAVAFLGVVVHAIVDSYMYIKFTLCMLMLEFSLPVHRYVTC